jgi:hypothetical protein
MAGRVQRPSMKFVPAKTAEHLDLPALYRIDEQAAHRCGATNGEALEAPPRVGAIRFYRPAPLFGPPRGVAWQR